MLGCNHIQYNHNRYKNETDTVCLVDGHHPGCGGLRGGCDKEYRACPHAVKQGPEFFCKPSGEIRDCQGDFDRCDLSDQKQAKIDFKKEVVHG